MIDAESWLIPLDAKKALILSDSEWGLEELEGLLTTLGGKVGATMKVALRKIDPGTYLGAGKLEELARILEAKKDSFHRLLVGCVRMNSRRKTICSPPISCPR